MQAQLAAGTTLKFTVTSSDYPASDGWVLSYRLTPRAAGMAYTFTATASGDDHLVNVARATTAGWAPGTYTVTAWVDKGAERYDVPSEFGQVVISPDPTTLAAGTDTRSAAEIALASVQALLQGKASSGTLEYSINGRQLKSYSMAELLRLESKLKGDVNREAVAAGKPSPYAANRIQRIFTRAA